MKIGSIEISDLKIGANTASRMYIGTSQIWPVEDHPDVDINYIQFSNGQYIDTGIYLDDLSELNPSGQSGAGFEYKFEVLNSSNDSTIWVVPADSSGNPTFYNKYEYSKNSLTAWAWGGSSGNTAIISSVDTSTQYNVRTAIPINYNSAVNFSVNNSTRIQKYFGYTVGSTFPHSTIRLHEAAGNADLRIYSFDMYQNSLLLSTGYWNNPAMKYSFKPVLHWRSGAYVPCLKEILHGQYCYPNTGTLIYG